MDKEEWKNIKGYEKFYKISTYGRVKAKRRVIYREIDGEIQPFCITKEKILVDIDNGNGYRYVTLQGEDGKRENKYIHRLVAEAFIPNPDNLPQVNHKDYDRKNNRATNLEWASILENIRYSLHNQPKRKNTRKTNTGYRYVTKKEKYYRVCIGKPRVDKLFKTLEEAIEYRDLFMEKEGYVVNG